MCAKKRHTDSKDFLHYLKDDLSNQERHALEQELEADPFEKEAMEGFESISPERAEEDILSLHAALNKRLGRRRRRTWYSIAATAASILLVGTIFLNIYDLNPNDKDSQAFTEESFRDLNSAKETPAAPASEEPAEELETESLVDSEEKAWAEEPARMSEENFGEKVEEKGAQKKAGVRAEDVEIVAVEAVPERSKRSASKEQMAAPVALTPESESAPPIGKAGQADQTISAGQVRGIVVSSDDKEPLPGVSIVVRGSNTTTVTDMEGRFTLPADDSQTKVIASFIGMETEEYQLDDESDNQLLMQADPVTLDEVVVIAQGNDGAKRNLSSSTKVIKTEEAPPSYSSAQPLGGYKMFKDYVEDNMVFPEGYTQGKREIVILRFTVDSSGSLSNIETLRTPGEPFTREATRLLQQGPAWSSAKVNGGPIDEQVRIRIVFKK